MLLGKRNIVWIASYPKSGNTWIRILLQNLLNESDTPVNINDLDISKLASSRYLFDCYAGISSSNLTEIEIETIRPQVYKRISEEHSDLVYFKVHDAWKLNTQNKPIFPKEITKAALYIIRNPLEISVSFAYHSNSSVKKYVDSINNSDFGLCIKQTKLHDQLNQTLLNWSEHVISWTERSDLPLHIIRYEDLKNKTFETFSKAISFLGLNYSKKQITTAITNSNIRELQFQEKNKGFKEKLLEAESFFRIGSNETWKEILDSDDIKKITEKNRVIMNRFGYNV